VDLTPDNTTVAVGTFGGDRWRDLAQTRAVPSAQQLGVRVVHAHAETLHDARNTAVSHVDTEWVIHLDADDQLTPGYLAGMNNVDADVRAPAVSYLTGAHATPPAMPRVGGHTHTCDADCLQWGNWIIVGAAVRTQLIRDIGCWHDYPWSEDWSTWARCWQAGATIAPAPQAVYLAHVNRASRNRSASRAARLAAHRQIATDLGLPCP
jgi:glycosyltransferase involved in cell wall biosynthesis